MTPNFSGHCLCGATRFRCTGEALWQSHCHCESCRRACSSAFTSFFGVANGTWAWTGAAPASYASSPGVWRDFCATCGAQMAYRSDRYPGEMHFYAALLDDPGIYVPENHVHSDQMLALVHLADGLPQR
ncbi:GFA family protein [Cypionkella sp. TWP1-2-1b2]|uniref:GFA family protein n=1 Tax=Cypionkella sp. TWP1-2-1b2 TaxID=2804675 RepID=UPI003CEC8D15